MKPEVTREQDGYIEIEWYKDPENVFSLSIGPNGEVAAAGLSSKLGKTCTDKMSAVIHRAILEFVPEEEE